MLSESPLKLHRDVRFRSVGEEGVVLNQHHSSIMVVNPVALRILELIRERVAPAQMVDLLCDEFEVAPGTAKKDLAKFLAELEQRAMLD